jgi:hypothetical protein
MREVAMGANSQSETEGVGGPFPNDKELFLCTRVRDIREELGRRIQRISAKSALTIADRLLLAYYRNVLKLYESLSPETLVQAGATMGRHCSDHKEEVREINAILKYLLPEEEITAAPRAGSILFALPVSARHPTKKGRPVTRRPAALRALQLQIDTGRTWISITREVCGCPKEKHGKSCSEAIRQSAIGLKRFLRRLGIELELPKRPA